MTTRAPGRPPKLFQCLNCKAVMPSSKVTGHKCKPAQDNT